MPQISSPDGHPEYPKLVERLAPGWRADGLLLVTRPGELDAEMSDWLLGKVDGRRSLGRTAFGDIVMFRDLRARALETGAGDPERECDVAMIDIHLKRMDVLGYSVDAFLEMLDTADFQTAFFRKSFVDEVRPRLGPLSDDECYAFVPALALGGAEDLACVQKLNWRVQQAILIQT